MPAAATSSTASTSTRRTSTSSTPGGASTRTRSRTCEDDRPHRNWDDERALERAGRRRRRGRGDLPQHRAAVLPQLRPVRPARRPPTTTPTGGPASRPTTAGLPTSAPRRPSAAPASARSSSTTSTTRSTTPRGSRSTACAAACCCRTSPPDVKWVKPLYDPGLRPAVGGAAKSSTARQLSTAARAPRTTGVTRCRRCSTSPRSPSTPSGRSCTSLLSGVFERFPEPEVRDDRAGAPGSAVLLAQLDGFMSTGINTGAIGELRFGEDAAPADVCRASTSPATAGSA